MLSNDTKKNLEDAFLSLFKEQLIAYTAFQKQREENPTQQALEFHITPKGVDYIENNFAYNKRGFISMNQRRSLSLDL